MEFSPDAVPPRLIPIQGSFRDSPDYRIAVQAVEGNALDVENAVKAIVKSTKGYIAAASELSQKSRVLAEDVAAFRAVFPGQDSILAQDEPLAKFRDLLSEIEQARGALTRQMMAGFVEPLEQFLKTDIAELKELKRQHQKSSDAVDSALDRYLGKRVKDPSLEESAQEVCTLRREFHGLSMQYAIKLNQFNAFKKFDLLEHITTLMYAHEWYFRQAFELFKDGEPKIRELSASLAEKKTQKLSNCDDLERIHVLKQTELEAYHPKNYRAQVLLDANGNPLPVGCTGYLIKKGSGKYSFAVWSRRWFIIQDDLLLYTTRGKDDAPTIAANLRLCTVKPCDPLVERRHCFEVVSPAKSYILQTESDTDMQFWIDSLQKAIAHALNSEHSTTYTMKGLGSKEKLDQDYLAAEHQVLQSKTLAIAEVSQAMQAIRNAYFVAPEWTSLNLGILICIECSAIHRSLGVHLSKVRSLTLDKWDMESIDLIQQLGNFRVNSVFEKCLEDFPKPTASSPRAEREKFVRLKYVQKVFMEQSTLDAAAKNREFWNASDRDDYLECLRLLASDASIEYRNPEQRSKTALLHAVSKQNYRMLLFLQHWNADFGAVDDDGQTCLHYATLLKDRKMAEFILKRNIRCSEKDKHGETPLDIALRLTDPDLVTMYRFREHVEAEDAVVRHAALQERTSSRNQLGAPTAVSTPVDNNSDALAPPSAGNSRKLSSLFGKTANVFRSHTNMPSAENLPTPTVTTESSENAANSLGSSAAAYANRLFKNGFASMHLDNAPKSAPDEADQDEIEQDIP